MTSVTARSRVYYVRGVVEIDALSLCPREEPDSAARSVRLEDGLYWLYVDGRRLRLAEPREVTALF